jgi:hypothetical protein
MKVRLQQPLVPMNAFDTDLESVGRVPVKAAGGAAASGGGSTAAAAGAKL